MIWSVEVGDGVLFGFGFKHRRCLINFKGLFSYANLFAIDK